MGELIPILGVSIPLVVVIGKFIIQPVTAALLRATEQHQAGRSIAPLEQRLAATEERLSEIERSLNRLVEESEFQRNLLSSRAGSPSGARQG